MVTFNFSRESGVGHQSRILASSHSPFKSVSPVAEGGACAAGGRTVTGSKWRRQLSDDSSPWLTLQPPLPCIAGKTYQRDLECLNAAIRQGEPAAISSMLWSAPADRARQLIVDAHKACFANDLDNIHFVFAQCVLKRFPEKNQFFTLLTEPDGSANPHRTILSPDGVSSIVKYLIDKGKLTRDIPTTVCDNYNVFKTNLRQMLNDGPLGQKAYYLVRHTDPSVPEPYRVHFTSVFVGRTHNTQNVAAFVSDCNSTAHSNRQNIKDPGKDFAFRLGQMIKDVYPSAELFTILEGRQSDRSNCPVFSLHDIVHMQKTGDMIAYAAGTNSQKIQNDKFGPLTLQGIEELPAGMIKVTQSLTRAQAFRAFLTDNERKEKLDKSLTKHTARIGSKVINVSITNKYLEYERYIFSSETL